MRVPKHGKCDACVGERTNTTKNQPGSFPRSNVSPTHSPFPHPTPITATKAEEQKRRKKREAAKDKQPDKPQTTHRHQADRPMLLPSSNKKHLPRQTRMHAINLRIRIKHLIVSRRATTTTTTGKGIIEIAASAIADAVSVAGSRVDTNGPGAAAVEEAVVEGLARKSGECLTVSLALRGKGM